MYLKSLKLTGFKSFADRTRLEFRPGVTVVVGPNGSGKSNLVDALSWVLGSQSPRSMRTPRMEDVIFAGTAARPSLNRAEVVLVIDNGDRLIDLDLDEVSITRRLYRDGSSDYELNGVGCRLLDIQDLLADTGVGRHQHVIIGQGEIGQVLNATPDENRAVIEEAAGILKHRRRKEKAERRLDRTGDDLARLQDVLAEIKRQMRPLRRQATAADRYEGLRSDIVALRLYLGGIELTSHDRELTVAVTERAGLSEKVEVDEARLGSLHAELEILEARRRELGGHLDRDTTAAALLETTLERLRRIGSIAQERRRAATGREQLSIERSQDLNEELAEIEAELKVIGEDRTGLAEEVETAQERFHRLEDEEQALANQITLSSEGALAAMQGELSGLEASLRRDLREITAIEQRVAVLVARVEAETAEVGELNTEVRMMDATVASLTAEYRSAEANRRREQERWTEAEQSMAECRVAVASGQARVEAIVAALNRGPDGPTQTQVLAAPGAMGALIDRLDVPEGLDVAVAAALEGWVAAVAFEREDLVRDVTGRMKAQGEGPVAMVSGGAGWPTPARQVAASTGVEAVVDLLGPGASEALATRFLGDVILAQGWLSAWEIAARHPGVRVVTPEGDLFHRGAVRLAKAGGSNTVLLEGAQVDLERARTDEARAQSILRSAKRGFENSREMEKAALESLESAETALAGRVEAMGRLSMSVSGLETEIARHDERKSALGEAISVAEAGVLELRSRVTTMREEGQERARVWEELQSRLGVVADERAAAMTSWQEKAARLQTIEERERLLEVRRGRIGEDLARLGGTVMPDVTAALDRVDEAARRALTILATFVGVLRERQEVSRGEIEEVAAALDHGAVEAGSRRADATAARDRMAALDVRITELRMTKEAIAESIRRDADADIDAAYGAGLPEHLGGEDPQELLATRLAELSRLGPINPLAAAEFHDLERRHDFLVEQLEDVEGARRELRRVITALDEEIQNRFQAAYEDVATAFEKYFTMLFPGGRGRVTTLDLGEGTTGVLIQAQPVGKKVSQLSLLSGGERSLAALAFLFAVFEARPSPFYILDEVEAALDDVNLRRFLRMVDHFRSRAQLVIVTHQQQTMEAADVLYGVTMEPGGASQALRKDMAPAIVEQFA